MTRKFFVGALVLIAVCFAIRPVFAQVSLSTLRGAVTDSSGAVVPNAALTLREPTTGVVARRQTTDNQGNFEMLDLRPGVYRLTCEVPGFKTFTAENVLLDSGQARRIDVALVVGTLTQDVVTVTANAAVINTETGSISGLYNAKQHADVPLVDAYPSPSSMLTLLPGIQGGSGGFGGLRASGQTTAQIIQGFDGINNDQGGQSNNSEFFQEVSATTVNAPAESSRVANINLTTKRGDNQFHGGAYYKVFSSALMARNFFAARRTPYLQHEWQLELGGPIIKNRTFIYGSWFSQRIPLGSFDTATVPTLAQRNGIFSGAIRDPLTGAAFPNNTIPESRISPVSAKFQQLYYPNPVTAGATNNYPFEFPFNTDLYKGDWLLFRVDHNITSKNSLYVRWLQRKTPYVLENGLPSLLWTRARDHQQWAAVDTHIFSPSLINTFRFGASKDYILDGASTAGVTPADGAQVLAQTGLQGSNPSGLSGQGFPTISISGYTTLANISGGVNSDNYAYTFDDSMTKTFGKHVAKVGVVYQLQTQFSGALPNYGSFSFDGSLSGNAYADFLLGIPRSASRTNPLINRTQRAGEFGAFAQDTFKVTQKLTVDYGLRWDYYSSPVYDDGLMYNFDLATGNVIVPSGAMSKVSPLYPKSINVVSGQATPSSDLKNFRPRLSAAYRLTPTLVVRGGYGAFTERLALFQRVNGAGPFSIAETYQNNAGQVPQFLFPNPFPGSLALATVPSQSVAALPSATNNGVLRQYNITVEKEIARLGLRASYIDLRGRGLNYSLNVNIPPPSTTPFTASRRPYPQLVTVSSYRSDGSSNYHSLELEAKRRAGDFTFDVNYSYQINKNNFSDLENPYDVLSRWANEANTRRQYTVADVIWVLPFGHGRKFLNGAPRQVDFVLGNWQLYWISYVGSGLFFSPAYSGSSPSNTGVNGGLPDLVGDTVPPGGRTYNQWFNPAAYAVPPNGRFGNALPNSLESQPLNVHHLSIAKRFMITEKLSFTMTGAISNLFNHPTFTSPRNNISAAGAGAFTSTVGVFSSNERGGPRQITFKGRFEF
jgi:hypothetical protein